MTAMGTLFITKGFYKRLTGATRVLWTADLTNDSRSPRSHSFSSNKYLFLWIEMQCFDNISSQQASMALATATQSYRRCQHVDIGEIHAGKLSRVPSAEST